MIRRMAVGIPRGHSFDLSIVKWIFVEAEKIDIHEVTSDFLGGIILVDLVKDKVEMCGSFAWRRSMKRFSMESTLTPAPFLWLG